MFEISTEDESGARTGSLHTSHGDLETPCFLPVATKGAVKTIPHNDLIEMNYGAIISNAFVLYLRPGLDIVRDAGGIHSFTGWDRAIFTDSGGFQMLNPDFLLKTSDEGVSFRSPYDRSVHSFTPEKCMEVQNEMGSDVAMVLDAVIPYGSKRGEHVDAVNRTSAWARRCKSVHKNSEQLLFAITQGGTYSDLRRKSAKDLVELGFDGYGIGGLSIGEPKEHMISILKEQTQILPVEAPRYLMGVGSPMEVLESIQSGVDIFDSTFPTRNARHSDAYTYTGEINLSRGRYRDDDSPIEEGCSCYTCRTHSRAFIHHLLRSHEPNGLSLMTTHNLTFISRLFNDSRSAIEEGRFEDFKKSMVEGINNNRAGKIST